MFVPRETRERKQKPEKRENEKVKQKPEKGEKKEHVYHQTNKKEVERENKRKAKEKLEKNTVKFTPSKVMFHGGDSGARLQVSLQNHGHVPRHWFSREKIGKTLHRSRVVDVKIDAIPDNRNSILVSEAEARKITVGQAIKDAVKETVNSGNEVGFLYDAALLDKHVRSPIVEGEEMHISGRPQEALANASTIGQMRQSGRLGLFHTHPLEPRAKRSFKEKPAYMQTASRADYAALGGSNDISVAIPHPEQKTPGGKHAAPSYTFIRTKGIDGNKALHDELVNLAPGALTAGMDKPHLKKLYEFFHELGGHYERVKINHVPDLVKDRAERDKVHRS